MGWSGQIAKAADGIALERKADNALVMTFWPVPRDRTQELGFRTDEILAKTSLKGPHGTFERRWRITEMKTTLCLNAAEGKSRWNGRESVKISPPLRRAERKIEKAPSENIACSIISTELNQAKAKAMFRSRTESVKGKMFIFRNLPLERKTEGRGERNREERGRELRKARPWSYCYGPAARAGS
ncbi:MAG: hypothetical protein ACTS4U_00865 [Candidatus Hodgkinia cicadicola]